MSDEQVVNIEAGEENHNDSSGNEQESAVTRRDFLQQALAVGSGLALSSVLPAFDTEAQAAAAQAASCPPAGQTFVPITEITRSNEYFGNIL